MREDHSPSRREEEDVTLGMIEPDMRTTEGEPVAPRVAALDAARQELTEATLAGPPAARPPSGTARRSTRCCNASSSRAAHRRAGGDPRARRLRPPAPLPPFGCRRAGPVRRRRSAPTEERFLRGFLHPLWDLHLVVGHQVRELADFERLETDNPEFLLALLDAGRDRRRSSAARPVRRGVPPARDARARSLELLQQLIDERHAKFNDTLYQLEPDMKDAPGALRDLLARAHDRTADRSRRSSARGRPTRRALDDAEDFLLRVRSIVHLESEAQPERPRPRAAGKGGADRWAMRARSRSSASSG